MSDQERKDYTDGLFRQYQTILDERDALQAKLDNVDAALDVVLMADPVQDWPFSQRLQMHSMLNTMRSVIRKESDAE